MKKFSDSALLKWILCKFRATTFSAFRKDSKEILWKCLRKWKREENILIWKNATCTKWTLYQCRRSRYESITSGIESSDWVKNADAFACPAFAELGGIGVGSGCSGGGEATQWIWTSVCATPSHRISSSSSGYSANAAIQSRTPKGNQPINHTHVALSNLIGIDIFSQNNTENHYHAVLIRLFLLLLNRKIFTDHFSVVQSFDMVFYFSISLIAIRNMKFWIGQIGVELW